MTKSFLIALSLMFLVLGTAGTSSYACEKIHSGTKAAGEGSHSGTGAAPRTGQLHTYAQDSHTGTFIRR